jgi:hypothetical protein
VYNLGLAGWGFGVAERSFDGFPGSEFDGDGSGSRLSVVWLAL